jgi:hypothetical protein
MELALIAILDFIGCPGIQENFKEAKMKKLTGYLMVAAALPAVFMFKCENKNAIPLTPTTNTVAKATPQAVQAPVSLLSAADFGVLASTQITNSGPTTICGDIGLSEGVSASGGYQLICNGVAHITDTTAARAQMDLAAAYSDAAGRSVASNPGASIEGDLGGLTLYPGLYKSTGPLEMASGDLTLDAQGNPNGVFIFEVGLTLTTGPGRNVILAGGAQAANVFWQVSNMCELATGTVFQGTIMAHDQILLDTGVVLAGRALSQVGQVTMLSNTITEPAL